VIPNEGGEWREGSRLETSLSVLFNPGKYHFQMLNKIWFFCTHNEALDKLAFVKPEHISRLVKKIYVRTNCGHSHKAYYNNNDYLNPCSYLLHTLFIFSFVLCVHFLSLLLCVLLHIKPKRTTR